MVGKMRKKNSNFMQFSGYQDTGTSCANTRFVVLSPDIVSFHGLRFAKRISVGKLCSGNFGLRKMSPVEGRMSQLMGESLADHLLVCGVFCVNLDRPLLFMILYAHRDGNNGWICMTYTYMTYIYIIDYTLCVRCT